MTIEATFYDLLKSFSTITDLVSTRIYPVYVPQGITGDCIVFSVISGTEDYSCDGAVGLVDTNIQITCIASRHATATAIARAVKTALNGYSDLSNNINYCEVSEPRDMPYIGEAEQQNRYAKILDCLISYKN